MEKFIVIIIITKLNFGLLAVAFKFAIITYLASDCKIIAFIENFRINSNSKIAAITISCNLIINLNINSSVEFDSYIDLIIYYYFILKCIYIHLNFNLE
jgi:hypothetical protein